MERAPPILLPDAPRADLGEAAPFRQAALRDHLVALVERHCATWRGSRPAAPVVALLGRFGQGKSSILAAVRTRLEATGAQRKPFIHVVDVGVIPPEMLSAAFERLIAPAVFLWRLAQMFLLLVIPALVVALGYLVVILVASASPAASGPGTAAPPIAAPLVPPAVPGAAPAVTAVTPPPQAAIPTPQSATPAPQAATPALQPPPTAWTSVPTAQALAILVALAPLMLGIGPLTQAIAPFATLVHTGPPGTRMALLKLVFRGPADLLLVDNLDRVTAEQQRALLRAIHRSRGWLGDTMVVVALDQGRLVDSSPDPETGPELLRKVFDLQLQMPPMTQDDARAITQAIFAEARALHSRTQPENTDQRDRSWQWLHRLIDNPLVLGDFARIVLLHRRHSQRFPRRLLNNALAAAHLIDASAPTEFGALLRLLGLFEHMPALQHEPMAIAQLMRTDDADGLIAHAERHLGKPLPAEIAAAVRDYMAATRHIHPDFADWESFTAWLGGDPAGQGMRVAQTSIRTLAWAESSSPKVLKDLAARWCIMDLHLAEAREPVERFRLMRDAWKRLEQDDDSDKTASDQPATMARIVELLLLHRVWLPDGDAQALLSKQDRDALLHLDWLPGRATLATAFPGASGAARSKAYGDFIRLLPKAPRGSHSLAQAALFSAHNHAGYRPTGKGLTHWLAGAAHTPEDEVLRLGIAKGREAIQADSEAPVRAGWPLPAGWAEAAAHVRIARAIRPHGCNVPLDGVGRLVAAALTGDAADLAAREGLLRTLAATCPDIVAGQAVSLDWDAVVAVEVLDTALDGIRWGEAAMAGPVTVLNLALVARSSIGVPPEVRFFVLLVLLGEARKRSAPPWVCERLAEGLYGLACRIRPTPQQWDLAFVDGLLRLDRRLDWASFGDRSRRVLRGRLSALPSALAEAGGIEGEFADRLRLWLASDQYRA